MSTDAGPAARPPRLRVRTARRHGWVRAGWRLVGIGAVLLLLGAASLWLMQVTQVVFAKDRARLGNEVRFDAEAARYQLILIRDPTLSIDAVIGEVQCAVQRSDGTTDTVGDEPQLSRLETDAGEEIASFDATAGPTTVRCALRNGGGTLTTFYAVARSHEKASWVGGGVLAIGALLAIAGSIALGVGHRGRAVVERVAADPPKT